MEPDEFLELDLGWDLDLEGILDSVAVASSSRLVLRGMCGGPVARSFDSRTWSDLESLDLDFVREPGAVDITDLPRFLSGVASPRLRRLTVRGCRFADELAALFARGPLAETMVRLAILDGNLTDAGARELAGRHASFRSLRRLDVGGNFLTSAGRRALAGFAPGLRFGRQRPIPDPDDWEYEDYLEDTGLPAEGEPGCGCSFLRTAEELFLEADEAVRERMLEIWPELDPPDRF